VQNLLIGRIGRLGRAPVLADQRRDGRAVDDVEAVERAGAGETMAVEILGRLKSSFERNRIVIYQAETSDV